MMNGYFIRMEKELKKKYNHFSMVDWYIKDSYDNILFTVICNNELAQKIVDKLNCNTKEKFNARIKMNNILIDDIIVLRISSIIQISIMFSISINEAITEQNKLMNFVVNKLTL